MEEIIIRLLREEDIQQINDLYHQAYKITRSTEKFRWEFQHGPAGPAIYVVAVDGKTNQVVGTQCAIPLYVVDASGRRILTAKSEDTLVSANYRGRSIFEKMYELLFEECRKAGVVAIWGFTYAIKPFRKLGFDIPFSCNFGLIAFNTGKAFEYLNELKPGRSAKEKWKIRALVTASRLKYTFQPGSSDVSPYTISVKEQDSLRGLQVSANGSFFLELDSKFMGWRLRSNPYPNQYLYYSIFDGPEKLVGCVVCSWTAEVSYVMHMDFDRSVSADQRKRVIANVMKDLSRKTSIVRFWGFTHNEKGRNEIELLKASGFIFTGQGISFVWKKLDDAVSLNVTDFDLSRMASQGT